MAQFTGQLNANEIQSVLFNMIISETVFADDIAGDEGSLVGEARVDGSLYGDTKLFISTDINETYVWTGDDEAANLLAVHRPKAPKCQKIVLDKFRQCTVSTDEYLSKRAFGSEGVFAQYNSRTLAWLRDTKKVHDETLYNAYIGSGAVSSVAGTKENVSIDVTTAVGTATGEEANRLEAQAIAKGIASLIRDMTTKPSRAYNDYKFMRKYSKGDLKIVWNGEYVDKITELDLPTVFHQNSFNFSRELAPDYFGTVNTVSKTTADADTRFLEETKISGVDYMPGEAVPVGTSLVSSDAISIPTYQVDSSIICKIFVKLPPFMSSFETETSFINGRALLTNHYLTWGYNTLAYLEGYPCIVVKKA